MALSKLRKINCAPSALSCRRGSKILQPNIKARLINSFIVLAVKKTLQCASSEIRLGAKLAKQHTRTFLCRTLAHLIRSRLQSVHFIKRVILPLVLYCQKDESKLEKVQCKHKWWEACVVLAPKIGSDEKRGQKEFQRSLAERGITVFVNINPDKNYIMVSAARAHAFSITRARPHFFMRSPAKTSAFYWIRLRICTYFLWKTEENP